MQKMISISLLQETPCIAVYQSGGPVLVPGTSKLPQRLAAVKADAAALPGFQPENVVAVVPSAYNSLQRSKLALEARQAGLKITRFLTAPAAAALMDYDRKQALYSGETERRALVCSLVGNFFDAAMVNISDGFIEMGASGFTENPDPESVKQVLRRLLEGYDLSEGPLSRVLMIGNAYYVPGIQACLQKYISTDTMIGVYSEEDLALGGAVLCSVLEGMRTDLLLLNAMPYSVSILTENNTLTTLLPKDTQFPCMEKREFTNALPNRSAARLWLYEGECKTPDPEALTSCIRITDLPPGPAGSAKIEITLSVDVGGFLRVDAKDLTTGKALNLEFSAEETGTLLRPLPTEKEQPESTAPPAAQKNEDVQALVLKFLPVYDDLLLALEQPTTDAAFKKGVYQTMRKLTGIFRELGVELYGDQGETFDPRIHNAVMHIRSNRYAENTVAKVLQKGVKLNGKIIRFAQVQVAN